LSARGFIPSEFTPFPGPIPRDVVLGQASRESRLGCGASRGCHVGAGAKAVFYQRGGGLARSRVGARTDPGRRDIYASVHQPAMSRTRVTAIPLSTLVPVRALRPS